MLETNRSPRVGFRGFAQKRIPSPPAPGSRYRIPHGGFFDYATQAVYFCESLGNCGDSIGPIGILFFWQKNCALSCLFDLFAHSNGFVSITPNKHIWFDTTPGTCSFWVPGFDPSQFVALACNWGFGPGWVSFFSVSWGWFRNISAKERQNQWGFLPDWENMALDGFVLYCLILDIIYIYKS